MFKPGDLVKVKSGGPVMTVNKDVGGGPGPGNHDRDTYSCYWFDDAGNRHNEVFPGAVLVKADQP